MPDIFGGDAESFAYTGLKDTPLGRLASFDFVVPLAKSHYEFTYGTGKELHFIGYHGTFFADTDSADLRELDLEATEFPSTDSVCRLQDKVQYARTKIGDNTFMLPTTSSMDSVYRNSTESLNETTFGACREYVGNSTISFDQGPSGNPADSATRPELRPLPAKTRVRVKIEPPIDSSTAAAGDPITGVMVSTVKQKGQIVVHAGDKLHGRIVRLEQDLGRDPRWTVAILFQTIERGGVEQKVSLIPLDDGDRSPEPGFAGGDRSLGAGLAGGGQGGFSPQTPGRDISSERPPGGGIYSFSKSGNLILGPKFESQWESR